MPAIVWNAFLLFIGPCSVIVSLTQIEPWFCTTGTRALTYRNAKAISCPKLSKLGAVIELELIECSDRVPQYTDSMGEVNRAQNRRLRHLLSVARRGHECVLYSTLPVYGHKRVHWPAISAPEPVQLGPDVLLPEHAFGS